MKNRSVGSELFHADRQVDKHDATNSRFSRFLRTRVKTSASLGIRPTVP